MYKGEYMHTHTHAYTHTQRRIYLRDCMYVT